MRRYCGRARTRASLAACWTEHFRQLALYKPAAEASAARHVLSAAHDVAPRRHGHSAALMLTLGALFSRRVSSLLSAFT